MKHQEFIIATDTAALANFPSGSIYSFPIQEVNTLFTPHTIIKQRLGLESDARFRQFLPYLMILRRNKITDEAEIYVYQRTKGAGESRLHGNHSIGLGGHPEIGDLRVSAMTGVVGVLESLEACLHRELREEVGIDLTLDTLCIRDNYLMLISDEGVDQFHLCLGTMIWVDSETPVKTLEAENIDCGFVPLNEVIERFPNLESWSKKLAQHLIAHPELLI